MEKTFVEYLTDHIMGVACLNFVEKTFVGGCKITKLVKVFSLESFLLYSTSCNVTRGYLTTSFSRRCLVGV